MFGLEIESSSRSMLFDQMANSSYFPRDRSHVAAIPLIPDLFQRSKVF